MSNNQCCALFMLPRYGQSTHSALTKCGYLPFARMCNSAELGTTTRVHDFVQLACFATATPHFCCISVGPQSGWSSVQCVLSADTRQTNYGRVRQRANLVGPSRAQLMMLNFLVFSRHESARPQRILKYSCDALGRTLFGVFLRVTAPHSSKAHRITAHTKCG